MLLWHDEHQGVRYEVRSHGQTLRLYANGVQHSEYHPQRLVTGSVWDLLWLPALFMPATQVRRVLLLGLGGGSVLPALQHYAQPDLIETVELDASHLFVAREFFAADADNVVFHHANALDWVNGYQGEAFDLVIEDLFMPSNTLVTRALAADRTWLNALKGLVKPGGVLVMNFGDWFEYRDSFAASTAARQGFAERFRLSTPDCHNAVLAFTRRAASSSDLRRRLLEDEPLAAALRRQELLYQIRKLA